MLSFFTDSLLSLAYPQPCRICRNSVENARYGIACRVCWKMTGIFLGSETICRKCGKFLSDESSNFETFCRECAEQFFDRARAAGKYEKALAASILHLKREPYISPHLRDLLLEAFRKTDFQDADKIIPMPLSRLRFLERGFNQALVLAEILSKETKIELDAQSLVRLKHTGVHRADMDKKARAQTVEKAFAVKRENLIRGAKILLVDDVFTSGATVSAAARALKKKGAEKVYVLTLARAV